MDSYERVRQFIHSNPRIAKDVISRMFFEDELTKNDLLHDWKLWARPEQRFTFDKYYTAILLLCGRGWGKSHWLSNAIIDDALSADNRRLLLMAADYNNLKKVNFLGDSGIISCINPNIDYEFNKSDLTLTFENGSQIISYSAEAYDKTRGSQYHNAYIDELAAWQYAEEGLEAARLVLRLGLNPRLFIATTPRPTPVIKSLAADDRTMVVHGKTGDNYFLPQSYLSELQRTLTDRMFRQECLAEILDDNPYALFQMSHINRDRVQRRPELRRIVVAVDPAISANEDSDETGIIVAGLGFDNHAYILEDCTVSSATPEEWRRAVIGAYEKWEADRIVAEVNQGGDMVEHVLRSGRPETRIPPILKIRASKGKAIRAEPVAAFYERGEVHHVGTHLHLERQMTEWDPVNSKKSPDRLDALVWAITELLVGYKGNASVSYGNGGGGKGGNRYVSTG